MKVILNGDLIAKEEAKISVDDRGFLLGDGLFETICVYNGKPLFFDRHWERLSHSLKQIYIPLPFTKEGLLANIHELSTANGAAEGKFALRLTISRGVGSRGINIADDMLPTYLITITPYPAPKQNISLRVSSVYRNAKCFLHQIKSLNYLDSIIARHEAKLHGYDEGLFLNTEGCVVEAPIANIFMIKNDEIITPALEDGIMPGVMRAVIIQIAKQMNMTVSERSVKLAEMEAADAVFLTNALVGILVVAKINESDIHNENKLVKRLAAEYMKVFQ